MGKAHLKLAVFIQISAHERLTWLSFFCDVNAVWSSDFPAIFEASPIGVAPIMQVTRVRNKNSNIQGGHLMW